MKSIFFAFIVLCLTVSCQNTNHNMQDNNCEEEVEIVEVEDDYNGWWIGHYVDEFFEETDNAYISKTFSGTFSNTATTNSKLRVEVLVDSLEVRFKLYEYGNMMVKAKETIWFNYKTQDGSKGKILCWNNENGYTGILHSWDKRPETQKEVKTLRNLIINNEEIKFNCSSHNGMDNYFFVIDTNGLNDALKQANLSTECK